jgi:hypothetical protein
MGIRISIILIILLLFSLYSYSADKTYYNKLKVVVKLKKDEQLVVIFQDIGSCSKCYIIPMEQLSKLRRDGTIKKFKLLALVFCDRDIELNIYKKQHNWKYFLYRDDGNARKHLGVKETIIMSVYDYYGKKILEAE